MRASSIACLVTSAACATPEQRLASGVTTTWIGGLGAGAATVVGVTAVASCAEQDEANCTSEAASLALSVGVNVLILALGAATTKRATEALLQRDCLRFCVHGNPGQCDAILEAACRREGFAWGDGEVVTVPPLVDRIAEAETSTASELDEGARRTLVGTRSRRVRSRDGVEAELFCADDDCALYFDGIEGSPSEITVVPGGPSFDVSTTQVGGRLEAPVSASQVRIISRTSSLRIRAGVRDLAFDDLATAVRDHQSGREVIPVYDDE